MEAIVKPKRPAIIQDICACLPFFFFFFFGQDTGDSPVRIPRMVNHISFVCFRVVRKCLHRKRVNNPLQLFFCRSVRKRLITSYRYVYIIYLLPFFVNTSLNTLSPTTLILTLYPNTKSVCALIFGSNGYYIPVESGTVFFCFFFWFVVKKRRLSVTRSRLYP